ncbi:MAG: hypothetical protein EZS28_036354, partial [Streblomastix strix]
VLKKVREDQIKAMRQAQLLSRLDMIYRTGKRECSIPYAWLEQRNSGTRNIVNQEEFETPSRQDMLFPDGPKFIRYYYAMEKFKKQTQIIQYIIFDLLTVKPYIIITEVLAYFISVNTSASSAIQFLNGLSSIISPKFDIDLKNNHKLQFTRKAISAHLIMKPKYVDTWNVGILFNYWRRYGSNRNLSNIELQTKLISLLMTIYSMRPAEIEDITLRYSVIYQNTEKVDLQQQTKTKSGLPSHKLPKT